jgi:hypothetical protein
MRQASAPTVVSNIRLTRPSSKMAINSPTTQRKETPFETEAACLEVGDEGVVATGETMPSVG